MTRQDSQEDLEGSVRRILGLELPTFETSNLLSQPGKPSPKAVESQRLAEMLSSVTTVEAPSGQALSKLMRQTVITGRTQSYKVRTSNKYSEAVKRVNVLYRDIGNKENFSVGAAKDLVNSFIDILKSDRNILLNLSSMPVSNADYLYAHVVNVSLLSLVIASAADYSKEQIVDIALAALLEDVGMIKVPESILSKAGPLSKAELFEIHKHPIIGANMLDSMSGLSSVSLLAIYQHHERMSGSGYPKKKIGHLIHPYSRIIAIADTYTALVANRSYRKRYTPYNAMTAIVKMGAAGLLDSALIRKFMECMSLFPLGSLVQLQSGRIGKVIHPNPHDFTKPTLMILSDEEGIPLPTATVLDLKLSISDPIVKALDLGDFENELMDGF